MYTNSSSDSYEESSQSSRRDKRLVTFSRNDLQDNF